MQNNHINQLTDRELLDATARAVDRERRTTAELLPLLAEMDARQLHLSLTRLPSRRRRWHEFVPGDRSR